MNTVPDAGAALIDTVTVPLSIDAEGGEVWFHAAFQ